MNLQDFLPYFPCFQCTVETERVCSDDGVKTVCKTRADGSEVCLEEEEHRSCIDVDKQVWKD